MVIRRIVAIAVFNSGAMALDGVDRTGHAVARRTCRGRAEVILELNGPG